MTSAKRKIVRILFGAEMGLSPLLAAGALLVPVAAHWGSYRYIPAIVWILLFGQCILTFRSRGMWFLLGPPVAFVAIELFLVAAAPIPKQSAASVAATDNTPANSATRPPLITDNPDGTFTI